jgi:hypothetical protein
VFELIHKVKAWHAEHEQTQGPVIVIDKVGGVEAATFCALMTLYDALHHEASVDVYTVAKLYCMKRPHVFPTEEDYLFLYKAVESLCNEEETCVAGDRDSGIANCNNYSVNSHPPPASPPPTTSPPGSPPPMASSLPQFSQSPPSSPNPLLQTSPKLVVPTALAQSPSQLISSASQHQQQDEVSPASSMPPQSSVSSSLEHKAITVTV